MRSEANAPTDAEIIVASLHDGQRFSELFDRHHAEVWRYLCRRAGPDVADELASETFLRAFGARGGFHAERPDALPWLYGIATNLLHSQQRRERRRLRAYARAVESPTTDADLEHVETRVDAAGRGPEVAAALADLKARDRDALLLLALTDLDYDGVAAAMHVPVGTVRSRLHRAREQLRRRLGPGARKQGADHVRSGNEG